MRKHLPKFVTLLAAASVSGWLFASGGEKSRLPAVDNALWRQECASCHLAFHPAFLPERSWRKMMAGLDRHFGENAELDAASTKAIAEFLAANAADRSEGKRARKVAASIAPNQTPLRISESPWFARKHDEVAPATWQRKGIGGPANCAACHPRAEQASFSEHEIRIPR
jgi:nitrate/TMAO reductase-like tetraheme cytochrome c subunit